MSLRSYPRPKRPTAKRWLWAVLVGSVLILGVYLWHPTTPIEHPPGVLVAAPPVQTSIDATPIQHGAYRLNTVATFEMDGRVLGTMRYSDDHARLAPWDLAIGWGPMSDSSILDHYILWQEARAYRWQSATDPLSTREVIRHSTNIHIVPTNADVAAQLPRLRPGHVVHLSGRLVDATHADGNRWRTSRSRTDAGYGACEILWLETLRIQTP